MAQKSTRSKINYLKIRSNGKFYTSHKEDGEGRVAVTNKETGKTSYLEEFDYTDDGYLTRLQIVEKEYPTGRVKELSLSISTEGEIDAISIPLKYSNGSLNEYVKNLATVLPSLDFKRKIRLTPSKAKDQKGYVKRIIYISYSDAPTDDNLVKLAHYYGEKGDIPKIKKTEDATGDVSYDSKEQDTYLFKILSDQIKRFEKEGYKSFPKGQEEQSQQIVEAQATITDSESISSAEFAQNVDVEDRTIVAETVGEIGVSKDDLPF